MSNQKKEWTYFDEAANKWAEPHVSRDELDALFKDGRINKFTECVNVRTARLLLPGEMGVRGVMYSRLSSTDVTFDPAPEDFLAARLDKQTTVLSGPNNGGKTFFLKHIYSHVGHDAVLVSKHIMRKTNYI